MKIDSSLLWNSAVEILEADLGEVAVSRLLKIYYALSVRDMKCIPLEESPAIARWLRITPEELGKLLIRCEKLKLLTIREVEKDIICRQLTADGIMQDQAKAARITKAKKAVAIRWEKKRKKTAPIIESNTCDTRSITTSITQVSLLPDAPVKESIKWPASLDTKLGHWAWDQWKEYKQQIGKKYKSPKSESAMLAQWKDKTDTQFAAAVRNSIANGYQGIFAASQPIMTGNQKFNEPAKRYVPPAKPVSAMSQAEREQEERRSWERRKRNLEQGLGWASWFENGRQIGNYLPLDQLVQIGTEKKFGEELPIYSKPS